MLSSKEILIYFVDHCQQLMTHLISLDCFNSEREF